MQGLGDLVSLAQFEPVARELLPEHVWNYVSGGAGDEITLRDSAQAWQRVRLAPQVLRDVSSLDTGQTLLGVDLPHPIILAPTARHADYHPQGEGETMRGARAAEAVYVQSSLGTTAFDDLFDEATPGPWWFQLYIQRDRRFTADLVARAVDLGASALVLTVDTPTLGARDRDRRDNLGVSRGAEFPLLAGAGFREDSAPPHRRVFNPLLSPDITWRDLEWLVGAVPVPVVAKGILRPDDARKAIDAGAAAIAVSNHGARNLDTVPATAEALPVIAEAVAGDVPIIVDGGIRRGTDVAKAIALGAQAVMIGRPYIWGLTAFGALGVQHVVEILRTELEMAMALLGTPSLADLTADCLWQPGVGIGIAP